MVMSLSLPQTASSESVVIPFSSEKARVTAIAWLLLNGVWLSAVRPSSA